MRKQIGAFVIGFLCCALIVSAMGAQFQQDDYQKACLGFMAEQYSPGFAKGMGYGKASEEACLKRREYWFKQLEKFKP